MKRITLNKGTTAKITKSMKILIENKNRNGTRNVGGSKTQLAMTYYV